MQVIAISALIGLVTLMTIQSLERLNTHSMVLQKQFLIKSADRASKESVMQTIQALTVAPQAGANCPAGHRRIQQGNIQMCFPVARICGSNDSQVAQQSNNEACFVF